MKFELLRTDAHELANPLLPAERLGSLSQASDYQVREAVAGHLGTSPEVLAVLAYDPSGPVRFAVAHNPNTPPATLATLAGSNSSGVRGAVASNPNAPATTIEELTFDPDFAVAEAARGQRRRVVGVVRWLRRAACGMTLLR